MINRSQICVRTTTGHKPIFPLHDHPKVLVVEQQDFDRQLFTMQSGQFLNVHLERTVAVDIDNDCVRMSGLNTHCGWETEAHCSQTRAA